MDSDYVWAILGLCCLLIMFAMMAAGIRNVRDEGDLAGSDEPTSGDPR